MLEAMLTWFDEWLFPSLCLTCEAGVSEGEAFCCTCKASLLALGPACPRCAMPTGTVALLCRACAQTPSTFAAAYAPWAYGGCLADALRGLKFRGQAHVARQLAPLWAPLLRAVATSERATCIVPVPHHWRRRWTRGYDQNVLLLAAARREARVHGESLPPITDALRVQRRGPAQPGLSARQRWVARRNVFAPAAGAGALQGTVVLFDDIMTTGATLDAAARVLLRLGATRVVAVTVARTP